MDIVKKKPKRIHKFIHGSQHRILQPNQIISFYTTKGGVGKTTLCQNLADTMIEEVDRQNSYKKILLIDLDSQMSLTNNCLGEDKFNQHLNDQEEILMSLNDFGVSYEKKDILSIMKRTDLEFKWDDVLNGLYNYAQLDDRKIDLIKGSIDLSIFNNDCEAYRRAGTISGYFARIVNMLNYLKTKYDLIMVDLNPEMSALNYSVLSRTDKIIMPIGADSHALTSLTIIKKLFIDKGRDAAEIKTREDKLMGYVLMKVKLIELKMTVPAEAMQRKINERIQVLGLNSKKLGMIEYFHGNNEQSHIIGKSVSRMAYDKNLDGEEDAIREKRLLQNVLRSIVMVLENVLDELEVAMNED